jgi:hypothetical protein
MPDFHLAPFRLTEAEVAFAVGVLSFDSRAFGNSAGPDQEETGVAVK